MNQATPPPDSFYGLVSVAIDKFGLTAFGLVAVAVLILLGLYVYDKAIKPLMASVLEIEKLRATQIEQMVRITDSNELTAQHLATSTANILAASRT